MWKAAIILDVAKMLIIDGKHHTDRAFAQFKGCVIEDAGCVAYGHPLVLMVLQKT